jgi:hypothetical protein
LTFSSPRPLAANVRLSESGDALPFHRHNVLGAKLLLPITYALRYSYHNPPIGNAIVEFNNRDHNSNFHLKHGVFRVNQVALHDSSWRPNINHLAQHNKLEKTTPTIHTKKQIEHPININTPTHQHSNTPSPQP